MLKSKLQRSIDEEKFVISQTMFPKLLPSASFHHLYSTIDQKARSVRLQLTIATNESPKLKQYILLSKSNSTSRRGPRREASTKGDIR